jgi:hypothetical protein
MFLRLETPLDDSPMITCPYEECLYNVHQAPKHRGHVPAQVTFPGRAARPASSSRGARGLVAAGHSRARARVLAPSGRDPFLDLGPYTSSWRGAAAGGARRAAGGGRRSPSSSVAFCPVAHRRAVWRLPCRSPPSDVACCPVAHGRAVWRSAPAPRAAGRPGRGPGGVRRRRHARIRSTIRTTPPRQRTP